MAAKPQLPPTTVFLLKTRSSPTDAYEDLFKAPNDAGSRYAPIFVPVLEHRFVDDGLAQIDSLLTRRQITNGRLQSSTGGKYGGMIFTSQRAVEAFKKVVDGRHASTRENATSSWPSLQDVPIYSVGPATTRALRAIKLEPPLQVSGEHTGNGEDLAHYIQEDYAGWKRPPPTATDGTASTDAERPGPKTDAQAAPLLPLLFVVGEQRRDIIPRVLMGDASESGPPHIGVDEIVVYGTGVMPSFAEDFERKLNETLGSAVRWVVVFSPTGCDSMLKALGLLDPETGRAKDLANRPRTDFIATIGPTTRAYLNDTFGFNPDVCADEPSPEGVMRGINHFMAAWTASQ
ncbi:uroporphyrinogen-III synthase [Sporothrix epigloea]|uniref:Uroporphyrinogen-III synthase n=1 Tax=Sporothrix epigloea TaxID=1892477 RepID=A0ABP0DET6_9PEZI